MTLAAPRRLTWHAVYTEPHTVVEWQGPRDLKRCARRGGASLASALFGLFAAQFITQAKRTQARRSPWPCVLGSLTPSSHQAGPLGRCGARMPATLCPAVICMQDMIDRNRVQRQGRRCSAVAADLCLPRATAALVCTHQQQEPMLAPALFTASYNSIGHSCLEPAAVQVQKRRLRHWVGRPQSCRDGHTTRRRRNGLLCGHLAARLACEHFM